MGELQGKESTESCLIKIRLVNYLDFFYYSDVINTSPGCLSAVHEPMHLISKVPVGLGNQQAHRSSDAARPFLWVQ